MKVKYKEDAGAWRKSTLLSVLGLLLVSSILFWRHLIASGLWMTVVLALVCVGALAALQPRWFRGYYRFSTWAGFWSSQAVARVLLVVLFIVLITPAALVLRLLGKDPLRLKRSPDATSYWNTAKPSGSLDQLF
jgi:hypothetical protein